MSDEEPEAPRGWQPKFLPAPPSRGVNEGHTSNGGSSGSIRTEYRRERPFRDPGPAIE
jgi:hypothetical protein